MLAELFALVVSLLVIGGVSYMYHVAAGRIQKKYIDLVGGHGLEITKEEKQRQCSMKFRSSCMGLDMDLRYFDHDFGKGIWEIEHKLQSNNGQTAVIGQACLFQLIKARRLSCEVDSQNMHQDMGGQLFAFARQGTDLKSLLDPTLLTLHQLHPKTAFVCNGRSVLFYHHSPFERPEELQAIMNMAAQYTLHLMAQRTSQSVDHVQQEQVQQEQVQQEQVQQSTPHQHAQNHSW